MKYQWNSDKSAFYASILTFVGTFILEITLRIFNKDREITDNRWSLIKVFDSIKTGLGLLNPLNLFKKSRDEDVIRVMIADNRGSINNNEDK